MDKLGLIFRPISAEQERILTVLSHALPCITSDNRRIFFDAEEADLYRLEAIEAGVEFVGYFNPMTA